MSGLRIDDHVPRVLPTGRPAIPPEPGPERQRPTDWPARLRSLMALVDELEDLDQAAALCSSSRRPELRGAGQWLAETLRALAEAPTTPESIGQALVVVAEAAANLRAVVAGRRAS